jgi:alpha-galactosidase
MEYMMQFGYYVTESSGHFSEYVPWFRKREDLVKEYCRDGYSGKTSFYADCWPDWRRGADEHRKKLISGEAELEGLDQRSHEFASTIIEAHRTNRPVVIYGNVINHGCIPNLPADGCVEVACMIDGRGIHPTYLGSLPEQCAALNRAHMAVHELMAEALLDNKREAAVRALMLDPHTASVCSLAEIRSMFDELWEAEKAFMPPDMK